MPEQGSPKTLIKVDVTGTSAIALAADLRGDVEIQNQGVRAVYINFGAAAVADATCRKLPAGAILVLDGIQQAIHMIAEEGTQSVNILYES